MLYNGKKQYDAVKRFLVFEGVTPKQIHERLSEAYKDSLHSIRTVETWVAEFKRSRSL